MKRLFLISISLFLLVPSLCFSATGDTETVIGKTDTTISTILGKAGTGIASVLGKNYTDGDGAASNACDSSEGSLLCEDWDGDDSLFTAVTTGGTANQDTAHSDTLACTDKGSECIQIDYDSKADLYAYTDLGSQQNVVYIHFYFNWVARPAGWANGDAIRVVSGSPANTGATPGIYLNIKEGSAEALQATIGYNSSSLGNYVAIAMNTWYEVGLEYVSDGDGVDADDSVEWFLDGVSQQEITGINLATAQRPRYIVISSNSEAANCGDGLTIQVEALEVDATDMPAACPE